MTNGAAMRLATPEDLPRLRALACEALVYDADAAAIVDLLWAAAADGCRIAAEDPESVAGSGDAAGTDSTDVLGFALGSLRPARDGRPATGHVDLLVVAADRRGRGLRPAVAGAGQPPPRAP